MAAYTEKDMRDVHHAYPFKTCIMIGMTTGTIRLIAIVLTLFACLALVGALLDEPAILFPAGAIAAVLGIGAGLYITRNQT
jgi:hypothetical protein